MREFVVGQTYWYRFGRPLICERKQDGLGRVYFSDKAWRYGTDDPEGKHRMGDFGYVKLQDIPQAIDMVRSFPGLFEPPEPTQLEMFE